MAWLLPTVTGVLAALVVALAVLVRQLRRRVDQLEERVVARRSPSSDPLDISLSGMHLQDGSLDGTRSAADPAEYVITRVGEAEPEPEPVEADTVSGPVFADLLLKETVVQTASLFQGLRRALAPETRNRIRFHIRQEVKRSRKQRRADLREFRREWAARQRGAMAAEEPAQGSAA